MKAFLSYSSEHVELAARIAHGLTQEGDDVFFDRESLPVGEAYHQRIRDAIAGADVFVFLVAPAAIAAGGYAVAELDVAARAAADGRLKMLPVMVTPVAFESLPAALSSITILQPGGDIVPAVLSSAADIRDEMRRTQVSCAIMVTNSGWMLHVFVIDPNPREIFVRFAGDGDFRSTGLTNTPNIATGRPQPRTSVSVPAFDGSRELQVRYIDSRGRERGPFRLVIDAAQAVTAATKDILEMTRPWVSLQGDDRRRLLSFTHLLSYKHAFKEIRYSLDDDSLSSRVHFKAPRPGDTGIDAEDEVMVEVPPSTGTVYVQLTFVDGTMSGVERFT